MQSSSNAAVYTPVLFVANLLGSFILKQVLVRRHYHASMCKKVVVSLLYAMLIVISHIVLIVTNIEDDRNPSGRFLEPFITIFVLNYFIWDFLVGPFLSLLLLKIKPGKRFYENMISKH